MMGFFLTKHIILCTHSDWLLNAEAKSRFDSRLSGVGPLISQLFVQPLHQCLNKYLMTVSHTEGCQI